MLKPFQIRDLHGPALQPDFSYSSSGSDGSHDVTGRSKHDRSGTVQISAHEYDETIANHPHSSLMYMDDYDGETVTVGSSFELSQRLDEPITSPPSHAGSHSPYQTMSDPIHIFDIRRSRSTLDLWRGFEKRTVERSGSSGLEGFSSPQSSVMDTLPTNSPRSPVATNSHPKVDTSAGLAAEASQRDIRTDWLQACRPPSMSPKGSDAVSNRLNARSLESLSLHSSGRMDDYLSTETSMARSGGNSLNSSCSITAEGRRQAQEAGAQFRNWNRPRTDDAISTQSSGPNPWSSYTNLPARLDDSQSQSASQKEPEPNKTSSVLGVESQPLLAAFEQQMSKIMEEQATAERSLNENNPDNIDYTDAADTQPEPTPATTEPSDSASRPSKPIEVLAQAVNNMVVGASRLSTELTDRLPEIERQVLNASRRFPDRLDTAVQGNLGTLGDHIQVLANAAQDASLATRRAAVRTRAADHHAIEQAVAERLRGVAGDLSSIGHSIFSSLESGLGASRVDTLAEDSTPTTHPTTSPGHEAGSAETNTNSNLDTSDSVPTNEAGNSCNNNPRDATRQTKQSAKPGVNVVSHPISRGSITSEPSTLQSTVPRKPLDETTSSDAVSVCGRNSQTRIPKTPTPGYSNTSSQSDLPAKDSHRPNRRDRSRSPSSIAQHDPSSPRAARASITTSGPNINHCASRRCRRRPDKLHARSSLPLSNHHQLNPAEARSIFNDSTATRDTLFLGIPGLDVTEAAIKSLLAEQGFLARVYFPTDSKPGSHFGFAYLKFPSIYAARAAKEALQGAHLGGKIINVEFGHGVNFDALGTGSPGPGVSQPGNPKVTAPGVPSALHRKPTLNLTNPEQNKDLKSKPSVTFADPTSIASATAGIKRHRSLGSLLLASGGPFPYGKPIHPTSSNPLNKHSSPNNAGVARDDDARYVEHEHSSRNKAESRPLLDQGDVDPEFSARYPSLLSTGDLRRTNTVSSVARQKFSSTEPEIARFPSLSQLEAQSFGKQQSDRHPKPTTSSTQHPPVSDSKATACESGSLGKHSLLDLNASNKLPGSWPQETSDSSKPDLFYKPDQAEGGSNAFKENRNVLNRSNSLVATDPAARLSGPFDPNDERSWNRTENLPKRSATERRPYRHLGHSLLSSGLHRGLGDRISTRDTTRQVPSWETYLGQPGNSSVARPTQTSHIRPVHANRPEMSQPTGPEFSVHGREVPNTSQAPHRFTSKIDACVEHLKALGFLGDGQDGEQRLRVYACAVDGNLGDAIEMIEEERKAYEQQPSLV